MLNMMPSWPLACSTLLAFSVPAVKAAGQVPCEQLVIQNPLGVNGFGESIALQGDTMAVGLPSVSFSPGYAFVYSRTASGWKLDATLQAPDYMQSDKFGWSLAMDGGWLIVGRQADGSLNSKGSIYTYQQLPNGDWVLAQKIANTKAGIWGFGWSLSIDGTRLAVGAKGASALSPKGRVYIFELENGLWVEKAAVKPSLDNFDDWFGASVDLQGDRLAVGAPKNGTGRAYVFDRQQDGTWLEQALFTPAIVSPTGDDFGGAVSLDGDTVVVGSVGYDVPFANAGSVFVYRAGPSGWSLEQVLAPEFLGSYARYGYSVKLTGNELFVGAITESGAVQGSGSVYRYQRTGVLWSEMARFGGSAPFEAQSFGNQIVRQGNDLVVAANAKSSTGPGKVYLYNLNPSTHLEGNQNQISTTGGGVQALQLGACVDHAGDFYLLLGSLSGSQPALPLGLVDLPLVFDAYTEFTLAYPNSAFLPNSLGQLDAYGRANAALVLPAGTAQNFVGHTVHHAYLVLDQVTLELETASNPTPLLLAP